MTLAGIEFTGLLGDAFYVGVTLAFFALCVGLVRACEWIIGSSSDDIDRIDIHIDDAPIDGDAADPEVVTA
jgi:hypothetical protein